MNRQHYDLVVIGGGSGGLAVAEKAAAFGKKVAVIEPHHLFGYTATDHAGAAEASGFYQGAPGAIGRGLFGGRETATPSAYGDQVEISHRMGVPV